MPALKKIPSSMFILVLLTNMNFNAEGAVASG